MSVTIAGTGTSKDTLTPEALRAIRGAQVLIGAKRLLSAYAAEGQECLAAIDPETVRAAVSRASGQNICILVSGDTGFYSAAASLSKALSSFRPEILPGISSVQAFFAKLGLPWQNAKLVSCHGRDFDLVGAVRRSALTFALTGGNVPELAKKLCDYGFGGCICHAGEDLGQENEKLTHCRVQDLPGKTFSSLTVLVFENPAADARILSGLPDDAFVRGAVPMTKSEVRAAVLSKLAVRPEDVCWDVGCGTGSVTIEMALAAYEGSVYGVDKNEEALALTKENARRLQAGNITVLAGAAPAVLEELPAPDRVFIGGSSGNLEEIVKLVLKKNPAARIVITAVSLETAYLALKTLKEEILCGGSGAEPEIIQLSVSRGRAAGDLTLLMAQNPVFLISGGPV